MPIEIDNDELTLSSRRRNKINEIFNVLCSLRDVNEIENDTAYNALLTNVNSKLTELTDITE